ncbi:MAG: hypothetical protein NTX52_00335, partial [Planctomycetota bacterium]|nr:hypothetical protein [Planctomycetota bacterium]
SIILMILTFVMAGCNVVKVENPQDSVSTPASTPIPYTKPTVTLMPDIPTAVVPVTEVPTATLMPDDLVSFNPPVEYPASLDEMWDFIDQGRYGWTFSSCQDGEPPKPYVTWEMAKLAVFFQTPERHHPFLMIQAADTVLILAPGGGIFPGTGEIVIEENQVFMKLLELAMRGKILMCSTTGDGKPTLYGPGIQEFLDWLGSYIVK